MYERGDEPGEPQVLAVGERVHSLLADADMTLLGLFAVPNSAKAIAPLIGQIQIRSEARRARSDYLRVYVFHNRPHLGPMYEPVGQRLLPLDAQWQRGLKEILWPTKYLTQICGGPEILGALIREYLFINHNSYDYFRELFGILKYNSKTLTHLSPKLARLHHSQFGHE